MTPPLHTRSAAADPVTAAWLRTALWRAAVCAASAGAVFGLAQRHSGDAATLMRACAAMLACAAVFAAATWARRRRVLRNAPWRDATVHGSTSATLFGTLRTTLTLTYNTGTTITYRLDDFASARTAKALSTAGVVKVASSPTGTVIATPTLQASAGARPHRHPTSS